MITHFFLEKKRRNSLKKGNDWKNMVAGSLKTLLKFLIFKKDSEFNIKQLYDKN
jgi:hypothetical protein